MDDITLIPPNSGKGLTKRRRSSKRDDVALLGEIMGTYIAPVQTSHQRRAQWEAAVCPIGVGRLGDGAIEDSLAYLGGAKAIHHQWLRRYAEIEATHSALTELLRGFDRVDPTTATRVIGVLFAALGKKKTDTENALLLAASVDMLSPLDESVGVATGLWEPINTHPFILALAVKALIARAVFTSASELRAEMKRVVNTIENATWAMEYIAQMIWRADEIMFIGDRAAWDANYASVGSNVAREMRDQLIDEDQYVDDDGNDIAPSPRWLALTALYEAKRAIEAAQEEGVPR